MVSFPNDILIQLMYKEVKNVKRQRVNLKSMCVVFSLSGQLFFLGRIPDIFVFHLIAWHGQCITPVYALRETAYNMLQTKVARTTRTKYSGKLNLM